MHVYVREAHSQKKQRIIVLETVFVGGIFLMELLNIYVSKLCIHTQVRKQHSAVVVGERAVCLGY